MTRFVVADDGHGKHGAPEVSDWDGVPGSKEDIIRHERG